MIVFIKFLAKLICNDIVILAPYTLHVEVSFFFFLASCLLDPALFLYRKHFTFILQFIEVSNVD